MAHLFEALASIAVPTKSWHFVGTSEACFDGIRFECVDDRLPWLELHDVQAAMAAAEEPSKADFYSENDIP